MRVWRWRVLAPTVWPAALGMGVGGVIFAGTALVGFHLVLAAVPWFYPALRILGRTYLMFLGYRIWRGAREPLHVAARPTDDLHRTTARSFCSGLLTQVSNPKTAVVYASIFVSLLPRDIPLSAMLSLPPLIFLIEAGWYSIVALALSGSGPRAAYLRSKARIDRVAGGMMTMLGVKLVIDARSV